MRVKTIYSAGKRDDVFYRRHVFPYDLNCSMTNSHIIDLADFPVSYGIIRVDKPKLLDVPCFITLGAYGFPDNGSEITYKEDGNAKAIILKGKNFNGQEKQLAMTIYDGWNKIDFIKSESSNPDSKKSIIIYAKTEKKKKYDGYSPHIFISQVITKESHEDFKHEEIFPISSIEYFDQHKTGAYGITTVKLKNNKSYNICFDNIEQMLLL